MTATTPKKKSTKTQAKTKTKALVEPVEPPEVPAIETPVAIPARKRDILFSKSGKGLKCSYYLFGKNALEVAEVLGVTVLSSRAEQPMLMISEVDFPLRKTEMEAAGYAIEVFDAFDKSVAEIRVFRGRDRSGANLFGEPAKIVANGLGLQAKMTRKNEPYVTVTIAQVDEAVAILETDRTYKPRVLEEAVVITSPGRYCLLDEAADLASDYFWCDVDYSVSGTPKMDLSPAEYEEFCPVLRWAGYYIKELSSATLKQNRERRWEAANPLLDLLEGKF